MCWCTGAELLAELRRREKDLGVEADWAVNAMMKAGTIEGAEHSVSTEFVIKMLGLDICADTIVGNAMKRGVSGGQKKRVTSGAQPPRVLITVPFCECPRGLLLYVGPTLPCLLGGQKPVLRKHLSVITSLDALGVACS